MRGNLSIGSYQASLGTRVVAVLCAALLIPASLAMLGATFDAHERNHAIGVWAGVGALTAAVGPVPGES